MSAVLGHPLHHALAALWEDGSTELVPIEGVVRTTRAYAGDFFYADYARSPSPDPEEEYRRDVTLAAEEGGFEKASEEDPELLWFFRDRYGNPDFRRWLEAPAPQMGVLGTYEKMIGEIRSWGDVESKRPEARVPESQQAAASLLCATAERLRSIDIWGLEWQAQTLSEGIREDTWNEIREIVGQASSKGRTAHPEVLAYWKETRKRLSGVIQDRRSEHDEAGALWWQLWKRERELVDAGTLEDYTPSEVAAYMLWERAGRRKTLVTFARHMGVSLRKDTAEEMVERGEG